MMESEHEQFSNSQPESGDPGNHHEDALPSSQAAAAQQETLSGEHATGETDTAAKRRRWRPSRSRSRRSAAAAEHAPEAEQGEVSHPEEVAEAASADDGSAAFEVSQSQLPSSKEAPGNEAAGNLGAMSPVTNLWTSEETPAPASAPEITLETKTPQAEQVTPSASAEIDVTSDLELGASSGAAVEALPTGDAEMISSAPTQEPQPEAQEAYEPIRAPLSGVEVRPPRRYRFDRPAPAARETHEPVSATKPAQPAQPVPPPPATQPAAAPATAQQPASPAQPATNVQPATHRRAPAQPTPTAAPTEDQELTATIERELTETPEIEADVEAAEELAKATQIALEEEVAEALETFAQQEAQAASARANRRRRRRGSSSSSAAASEAAHAQPQAPTPTPQPQPQPQPSVNQLYPISPPPMGQNYQVNNGLQQINQPQSPFAGPEPSSARGFGPVPHGIARPAERSVRLPRTDRTIDTNNVTINQLATLFTQAMQQQTDRLLMELRRNQGTPSMTVNFPPMPSTERVGVFVDVANLLYSARNMRIAIDFGRLLDFLRGNRRLIRAHAYCPTSPDPRAEQMFLDAVKGLGYRITTKNYKTFSSGAKKADLDLDMCMDIVRLVDADSVDCISLVSGDSDFLPLLEYCSDHGVRVEVAAFDEATAGILRQSCDLFINLSLVEEIRA